MYVYEKEEGRGRRLEGGQKGERERWMDVSRIFVQKLISKEGH